MLSVTSAPFLVDVQDEQIVPNAEARFILGANFISTLDVTFPSAGRLEGHLSRFRKHLKPEITAGVPAVPVCTSTATVAPVHTSEQESERSAGVV